MLGDYHDHVRHDCDRPEADLDDECRQERNE